MTLWVNQALFLLIFCYFSSCILQQKLYRKRIQRTWIAREEGVHSDHWPLFLIKMDPFVASLMFIFFLTVTFGEVGIDRIHRAMEDTPLRLTTSDFMAKYVSQDCSPNPGQQASRGQSVTRCWNESSQIFYKCCPKRDHSSFFFKSVICQSRPQYHLHNIWASLQIKFVVMNFQKISNLVTLQGGKNQR